MRDPRTNGELETPMRDGIVGEADSRTRPVPRGGTSAVVQIEGRRRAREFQERRTKDGFVFVRVRRRTPA